MSFRKLGEALLHTRPSNRSIGRSLVDQASKFLIFCIVSRKSIFSSDSINAVSNYTLR